MAFGNGFSQQRLEFIESLLRSETPMSAKLKPQFFPERFALLEALEELFEDADDNRVDTDPLGFCPCL
jgi:hypothetical protein